MEIDEEKRERLHQEDLKRLASMRPFDDTFMKAMFKENIPLAEMVLRIILNKEDLVVTHLNTQADMTRVTGARSICLDVYGTDSFGKKYDIEVQRADKGASHRRARYHSSVLDVENLDAKEDFDILIKKGWPFYLSYAFAQLFSTYDGNHHIVRDHRAISF